MAWISGESLGPFLGPWIEAPIETMRKSQVWVNYNDLTVLPSPGNHG